MKDSRREGVAAAPTRLAVHAGRQWAPNVRADANEPTLDLTGTAHLFDGAERFC